MPFTIYSGKSYTHTWNTITEPRGMPLTTWTQPEALLQTQTFIRHDDTKSLIQASIVSSIPMAFSLCESLLWGSVSKVFYSQGRQYPHRSRHQVVLHCIVQCRELCPYPEELDNNWFHPASAPALSFHQVCTCFCLISCEPIVAATVLSTLAHAPESSPDWSWEHYCQEEEEEEEEVILSRLQMFLTD